MTSLAGGHAMKLLRDRAYECQYCGATLTVAPDAHVHFVITAHSGRANIRRILVGPREIHACEVPSDHDRS
jgi:hypothetical protein